jgi:hypothetical protein
MTAGDARWWATKVRQVRRHLGARVVPAERAALRGSLTPAQLELFEAMHVADRRHGLDVAARLRADGVTDPDVLLAGLLHDAGKGRTGLGPRIVHSLGEVYGGRLTSLARRLPGTAAALDRLRDHAELSAALAAAAGCSERTVELIRWQAAPRDPDLGVRLRLADEAS